MLALTESVRTSYRLEPSGKYYGLLKRGGKQFRRSLKTTDRRLAERRLLTVKRPGLLGALTNRAEAYMMRLGDIRVRNLAFRIDGELESAGQSFLASANLDGLRRHS